MQSFIRSFAPRIAAASALATTLLSVPVHAADIQLFSAAAIGGATDRRKLWMGMAVSWVGEGRASERRIFLMS